MPSPNLSTSLKSLVTIFTGIFKENQEALGTSELNVFADYGKIAQKIRHYDQSPGFLTEDAICEIHEMIERWKANLDQISARPEIRILKLRKRYDAIDSDIDESKLSEEESRLFLEIAHCILGLAQDDDNSLLTSAETKLEQLEQSLCLKKQAANAARPVPSYVEEIISRAKARSRAFHFASDQRQRAILRPFAQEVAQKLKLKVELQTIISTTLQHLKRKA